MNNKENSFSVTFYNGQQKVMFLEFVQHQKKAIDWVNKKGIVWTWCNVWNRRTREHLERINNDNYIKQKAVKI